MNPYQVMYVLPKDRYQALLAKSVSVQSPSSPAQSLSTPAKSPASLCSVCGLDFKHPNILAHHMKSHYVGHKCNICGKVFKQSTGLQRHLRTHAPQAPAAGQGGAPSAPGAGRTPSAPGPGRAPSAPGAGRPLAPPPPPELRCSVCNKKMKHKRNLTRHMRIHSNTLKFKASKWETLN